MPIYQYKCPACDANKEKLTYMVSPPRMECECGEEMIVVYCAPMLQFKGNGFYETDYKEKKHVGPTE